MIKNLLRKIFGLKKSETLSSQNIIKRYHEVVTNRIFKEKYTTSDIIEVLKGMGIGKGSNIFIHSAWDSFSNYQGAPEDLINALIDLVGEDGNIAMPGYPLIRKKKYDIKNSVTKAGILPESFRKYPGVYRSANVRHAVCAFGPLAEEITNTHHLSKIRFDEYSPYYKMIGMGFKTISLGLPTFVMGTFVHCVEATMWRENPYFKSFYDFDSLVEQKYIDVDGVEKTYTEYKDKIVTRNDYIRNQYLIKRYFDSHYFMRKRLSNLMIGCTDAKYTYNRLCELARQGIVIYVYPRYRK